MLENTSIATVITYIGTKWNISKVLTWGGGGQGFNSFTNVKENKFQYLFKFVRVFLGQQSSEKLQAVQSCLPVNDGHLTLPSTSRYGEEFGY